MVMVCVCTIFIAGLEADVGEVDAPHEGGQLRVAQRRLRRRDDPDDRPSMTLSIDTAAKTNRKMPPHWA
jgi:hypothetical protein